MGSISSRPQCVKASGYATCSLLARTLELDGNQSKRPHSKMATTKTATTRTATPSGITTRTATLLWSKRPHCFGQNGHISWLATKTATLHLVKTATLFLVKTATGRISSERSRFGYQNGLTAFSQNGHTLFGQITDPKWTEVTTKTATLQFVKNTTIILCQIS